MKEAGRAGGRAVAVLIVDDRGVGTGFSDAAVDRGDQASLSPPNVDHRLARGDNDAALAYRRLLGDVGQGAATERRARARWRGGTHLRLKAAGAAGQLGLWCAGTAYRMRGISESGVPDWID